jgi:ankyrin repeat protein
MLIISEHPDCVKQRDDLNQLPLHLALSTGGYINLTKKLIKLYPAALQHRDDNNQLSLHVACMHHCSESGF